MTAPERLLRRRALGSDAVYRVVGEDADGALVEVVEAPGLEPGFRFRLSAADVRAMEAADAEQDRASADA